MNRSKIDWTDYTWNPVTGCLNGCPYCFARRQSQRFGGDVRKNIADFGDERQFYTLEKPYAAANERVLAFPFGFAPTFHQYRLDWPAKLKNCQNVFVCSMGDLFGPWVPSYWICQVIDACRQTDWHNYMFLTKYPERYRLLEHLALLPHEKNYWYGTTVTRAEDVGRIAELPQACWKFVSAEPLHGPMDFKGLCTDWVIIGAETGNRRGKVAPEREWVEDIVAQCHIHDTPVFMKESLRELMGDEFVQQFPSALKNKPISEKMRRKLIAQCGMCGEEHPKKEMVAILKRFTNHGTARSMGYLCKECTELLQELMDAEFHRIEGGAE